MISKDLQSMALDIPSAIDLAYELGELPFDLRRMGIPVIRETGAGGSRLKQGDEYELRLEESTEFLRRFASGADIRIIGLVLQDRRNVLLVRSESPWRTVADLRGRTLGVARNNDPLAYLRRQEVERLVGREGIMNGAPQWVELSAEHATDRMQAGRLELRALLRKEADAVYVEGGLSAEAQRLLGVREVEGFRSYTPVLAVLTASPGWIHEQPAEVGRLLAHIYLASDWALVNRSKTDRLVAKQLGLPEHALASVFSDYLHQQLGAEITDEKWDRLLHVQKELNERGWLQGTFALEDALDHAVMKEAERLIASHEVERPQSEPLSAYAERDLPLSFFIDRAPAHVLADDAAALEAARTFAEEIRAEASERDRNRKLPLAEMKRYAELGLLGLIVPKAYGGPDVSTRTLVDIFKIISHADGSIGQIPQNHHFFAKTIELVGSEEQKSYFFQEILQGAQFGNGLAERNNAKGARKILTTIRQAADGDGYELNGSKFYSTGALYSHWIPVTALNDAEQRMTAFVPRHAPGVTVLDDWSGIGQRTTASGSVLLRNVNVPPQHLLPHWQIFEGPQYFSAFGQIMHAAIDYGIAKAALEDAAYFVREHTRPAFGSGAARASEEPDLIRRFGELGIRLQAAEALLDRAAGAIDEARSKLNAQTAGHASMTVDSAKWLITETAIEITNALFEVAGTSSMDRKYNYDRHWRSVRIHTLHDPARLKLHHVGKWFLNGVYHEYKV